MARSNNLPAKKHKAGQRTETRLHFKLDVGNGGTYLIDIAKALSQVNRRAYRQGLYYYASKVTFSNNGVAYASFNTAMDNWCTLQAWKRGYRQWAKMNRKAMADLPNGITPKYHDYKISLQSSPALSDALNAAYGQQGATGSYSSEDWDQSVYVTEDPPDADPQNTDSFLAHLVGPHTGSAGSWTSIGLIRSLNDSWPRSPEVGEPTVSGDADTDPLANLFDAGDNYDDVRLNLDEDNDQPPYDESVMPGSASTTELQCRAILRTGTGAGSLVSAPGFCIPFGLLNVVFTDFGESGDIGDVEITIDIVPGSYNGVHAERVI